MLQRIQPAKKLPALPIAEAAYPAPFAPGLEYSPAARGTWNIVHTGMLLPESHQIYICAAGCLRGVVLTAAEMGDAYRRRFSALELREDDLYRTDHETFLIEGITDILRRLPRLPRAVLVFTACVHHFLGCNLRYVYRTLRERFPSVAFAECVMDPIRQTKSLTPEERERREIYRLLPSGREKNRRLINLIGSNLALTAKSDIKEIAHACGRELLDLTECHSYDDFLRMGEASENLYTNPFTHVAARDLLRRLGQDALFLPQVWRYEEICDALTQLVAFLGGNCPDLRPRIAACELALEALHVPPGLLHAVGGVAQLRGLDHAGERAAAQHVEQAPVAGAVQLELGVAQARQRALARVNRLSQLHSHLVIGHDAPPFKGRREGR